MLQNTVSFYLTLLQKLISTFYSNTILLDANYYYLGTLNTLGAYERLRPTPARGADIN